MTKKGRISQFIDDMDRLVKTATDAYSFIKQEVESARRQPAVQLKTDPYVILGVDRSMPLDQKKQRYKELMRIVHSDRGGDDRLASVINNAWDEVCRREGRKK